MAVVRSNETNAAMQMLRVIPSAETINPNLGRDQVSKRLSWEPRSIFHRSEPPPDQFKTALRVGGIVFQYMKLLIRYFVVYRMV